MVQKLLPYITNYKVLLGVACVFFLLFVVQTVRLFARKTKIRSDAIKRSRAVIGGQVVEQVAPFLPNFPCSPSDARFIGKPVDFIAFPGLAENDTVKEVLLIEVKTGQSALNSREKEIKKAVAEGRVRYVEYRV